VALTAGAVLARPIDETRPAAEDVRLTVENINGTVTVEGWSKKEVHVTGTLGEGVEELVFEGNERRLRIEVEFYHRRHNEDGTADLNIKVPTGAEVLVDVVNCPIEVSKVEGSLDLESVNGDISISGKPSRIEAGAVNGDITITATCNDVEASNVNGDIILDGVSGEVSAESVGGTIEVRGGRFDGCDFGTVSGDIEFDGEFVDNGRYEFEAHSGDVTLTLPAKVSADFEVSTFSGDIDNDFGPRPRRSSEYGPGKELYFTTGDGKCRVSINTFSGDVRLRKK
jgi:DUF4097 and DUF4098 domain-containing protein YvlB